jgi:hypothetical protein
VIVIRVLTSILQVGQDRLAYLLWQWEPCLASPLADHTNAAAPPIEILEAKSSDIGSPKSEACQKEKNRSVPPTG